MKDATSDVVTLTITLDDVEPCVWRRLEVPADYSFDRLHQALSAAVGWLDLHLHEFEVAGKRYSDGVDMSAEADAATLSEADLVLGDVVRSEYVASPTGTTSATTGGTPSRSRPSHPHRAARSTRGARTAPAPALLRIAEGRPDSTSSSGRSRIPSTRGTKSSRSGTGAKFDPGAFSVEATSALLLQVATGELPEGWEK